MPIIRNSRPTVPAASATLHDPERGGESVRSGDRANAGAPVACDRVERGTNARGTALTHYLSLGADVGFLIGVQASLTLAGGRIYGSIGEFSGVVPGVGASLEAGVVRPHCGQSDAATIEGTGVTASAGFGVGVQTTMSAAGTLVGGGLTSPTLGVGITQTRKLSPW